MAIENTEEAALWPVFNVFLCRWLHDVEDNANTIFVVVPDYALVCVGCVTHDEAILADTAFRRLPAGQVERSRVRRWTITKKQLLDV